MICAENLSFSYNSSAPPVLSGLDFCLLPGEYVSIVGENGCGKSTLLKLLLGFLRPVQGSITTQARRRGYVPQRSEASSSGFPITVFEMLDSYRRLLKVKGKRAVTESLRQVGLLDKAHELIGNLSGGQAQRAIIARALLGDPELLILDEPSVGIDRESQQEIYDLLKRLNVERGITIVSVEHNLGAAIANSTAIFHLAQGQGHFCNPQKYAEEYMGREESDA